jgi:4-hydroxybenzoate polyprenyltransferase
MTTTMTMTMTMTTARASRILRILRILHDVMSTARAILRTLRPHQWVKNLFVVAPLVFSKHLFDPAFALRTLGATLAFCALSGAVYVFNDLRDIEADRVHPTKRHRPLPAGQLSENTAIAATLILSLGALAACLALSWKLAVAALIYALINLGYSLGLKHVAYLDVALIAAGFLLRVLAGALVIDVPVSPWLVACTGLLAALLGFGKRAHEVGLALRHDRDPRETRASLAGYGPRMLTSSLIILALATCAAYALYTQDPRTVASFHTRKLVWTLPFCVFGIARFLQLALWRPRAHSPTDAMLRDWPFLLNLVAWGAAVLIIIYRG